MAEHYEDWLRSLRETYELSAELRWGMDINWEPVDFNDPHCIWRGVLDLSIEPHEEEDEYDIMEWKTGKEYEEHAHQSSLYGLVGHRMFDEGIKLVRVTNVYVDRGYSTPREYMAQDMRGLQALWDERRKELERDTTFPARPGFYCRWCDFSKDNGGPCQF